MLEPIGDWVVLERKHLVPGDDTQDRYRVRSSGRKGDPMFGHTLVPIGSFVVITPGTGHTIGWEHSEGSRTEIVAVHCYDIVGVEAK